MDSLKPSVQIAIGKQCDERTGAIKDDAFLEDLKSENIKACGELDEAKLTSFGVDDCPATVHDLITIAMEMECMGSVAEAAAADCETVDAECKEAVDTATAAWKPEELPMDEKEQESEKEEGEEAVVAVLQSCSSTAEASVKDSSDIADACDTTSGDGPNADFMKVMDVSADDCLKQAEASWVLTHSALCLAYVIAQAPEDPADVTKEDLKSAVDAFWDNLEGAMEEGENAIASPPADRLRLYQSTLKSKKWPRKAATPLKKMLILGAASGVALMALVVVVRHRRATSVPADEEMLMTDE